MTSRNRRLTQADDIKRRAKAPSADGHQQCLVPGCRRPTQRAAAKGLSENYCRIHMERLARHGHATRASYSKAELKPYRRAAQEWFRQHQHEAHIRGATARLESLMASQGPSRGHNEQRGMPPKDKARNVLARLHEAGKSGGQLFLIVLAIRAAYADLGPRGYPEFPLVQIAKQAKRLRGASGTHYRSDIYHIPSKYPRPRGLYLRLLGKMIEERADIDRETLEAVRREVTPDCRQPAPPPRDDTGAEARRMGAYPPRGERHH